MLAPRLFFAYVVAGSLVACAASEVDEPRGSSTDALTVCAPATTQKGVDVAHYEGRVDWRAVKDSGRSFAFAKTTEGVSHPDATFETNWAGIAAVGMIRGAYHLYRPSNDPIEQADAFLDKLAGAGGLKTGDLPPVLDLEKSALSGYTQSTIVAGTRKWLAHVEAKLRVKPIVYAGNDVSPFIGTALADYLLWLPRYGVDCPNVPEGWQTWTFWQTSESGSVPGIDGDADVNLFNGSAADLRALTVGHHSSAN